MSICKPKIWKVFPMCKSLVLTSAWEESIITLNLVLKWQPQVFVCYHVAFLVQQSNKCLLNSISNLWSPLLVSSLGSNQPLLLLVFGKEVWRSVVQIWFMSGNVKYTCVFHSFNFACGKKPWIFQSSAVIGFLKCILIACVHVQLKYVIFDFHTLSEL